jgi:hypothetical protein
MLSVKILSLSVVNLLVSGVEPGSHWNGGLPYSRTARICFFRHQSNQL